MEEASHLYCPVEVRGYDTVAVTVTCFFVVARIGPYPARCPSWHCHGHHAEEMVIVVVDNHLGSDDYPGLEETWRYCCFPHIGRHYGIDFRCRLDCSRANVSADEERRSYRCHVVRPS